MQQPSVSVIVNTLDRAASLDRTLTGLRQLRYPNFEVIVVPGPCSDTTPEILARYTLAIRVGHCPKANLAMSRNIGIAMARGEILAFIDDDAVPEPDWLDRLVEGLRDPKLAAVGGFIRDRSGIAFQHRIVIADRFGDAEYCGGACGPPGPDRYASPTGTNIALRREAVLAVGGFDEYYAYFLDETDLNLRLIERGWRLAFVPEAEVHHEFAASPVRTADHLPRSMDLIARSKAYFCWVNARPRYSEAQILDNLSAWRRKQRRKLRRLGRFRKNAAQTSKQLIAEVEKGVEDGARDARSQAARMLLSDALIREHTWRAFRPFVQRQTPRLRLCFLSREFPPHGRGEIGRWTQAAARGLADHGHEVTVICLGPRRSASVEFIEGVWVHRIIAKPLSRRRRQEFPLIPPHLLRYSAAAADEIIRIRPRRDYQILISPLAGLEAAVPRHIPDLHTVIVAHGMTEQLPFRNLGRFFRLNSGAQGSYRTAQAELLQAASLVLSETSSFLESVSHLVVGTDAAGTRKKAAGRWQASADRVGPRLAVAASFEALESHIAGLASLEA